MGHKTNMKRYAPAKKKAAGVKPTWQSDDGRVQLYRGDALKILQRLDAGFADLVILDPPYGTTQLAWDVPIDLESIWAGVSHARNGNAIALGFGCQPFFTDLIASNRREFRYELIWKKSISTGYLDCNRRPLRSHENIGVFVRRGARPSFSPQFWQGRPYTRISNGLTWCRNYGAHGGHHTACADGRRFPLSVVESPSDSIKGHQTRKPLALCRWLIRSYSATDDIVLDPFLGSGSTAEAAIAEGRRVIGIEMDRARFQLATRRIKAALEIQLATKSSREAAKTRSKEPFAASRLRGSSSPRRST